jgi:Family of unknown function (DUF5670)
MLWTISTLFFCLWLLGIMTPSTFNGYVHILLLLAVAPLLIRFFRKPHAMD